MHLLLPTDFGPDVVGDAVGATPCAVWDGVGEPPPLDDVTLYVPPYMGGEPAYAVIPRMPALKVVQTLTAGVDGVLPHLPEGVTLCNAGGVHDTSTAELALTLVLASLRGLPDFVRAQDAGVWAPAAHASLADRVVVVVGAGGIARALEHRMRACEAEVHLVGRSAREGVHGPDELPGLLGRADVLVLAVPLTPATRRLVDAALLAALPDGALVVNVARGPVLDTAALVAELERGRLRAALDVTDPEPLPAGHPLWRAPGVLLSPHVGGNSSAFAPRAAAMLREQLRRYVAGEPLEHVVEPPS